MNLSDFPRETRDLVTSELKEGETLLWLQRPNPTRIMLSSIPIFLFAIPWTAFSIFWMYGASGFGKKTLEGPAAYFPLFGLPFLLIGICLLLTPFWLGHLAKNSVYILSNKRAICMNKKFNSYEIKSFTKDRLGEMKKVVRPDGSGDLVFEEIEMSNRRTSQGQIKSIGFIGIKRVNDVEEIIRNKIIGNLV